MPRVIVRTEVNFLGGYSALVSKGMTQADRLLMESIPEALAVTEPATLSPTAGVGASDKSTIP